MAGGGLQRAGGISSAVGALALIASIAFPAFGIIAAGSATAGFLGTAGAVGVALGAALTIAGSFITPIESDSDANRAGDSPTYGFQVSNRPKGDAPIQVHLCEKRRVTPNILQAYTTPEGLDTDDDFAKVLKSRGESLSMLFAVGEGPLPLPSQIYLDEQELFGRIETEEGGPRDCTRMESGKKFRMPGRRPWLPGVDVYVNGENISAAVPTLGNGGPEPGVALGNGVDSVFVFDVPDVAAEYGVRFHLASLDFPAITGNESDGIRPHAFFRDERTLVVNTQVPLPNNIKLFVVTYRRERIWTDTSGPAPVRHVLTAVRKGGEGFVKAKPALPASATVGVKGLRILVPGVTVEWRPGTAHQLSIPGFNDTSQSRPVSQSMGGSGSPTVFTSIEGVDDLVWTLASGPNGFTYYKTTDKGIKQEPVSVKWKVEWKWQSEPDAAYRQVYDPGTTTANPQRFKVSGDSRTELLWAYSLRGLIDRYLEKHPNKQAVLDQKRDLTNGPKASTPGGTPPPRRLALRFTRIDSSRNAGNSAFIDDLIVKSVREIQDDQLTYPHTAVLGLHAIAGRKVNGAAPKVSLNQEGLQDVQLLTTPGGVPTWTQSPAAKSNPVWATCELWSNKRWGHGEQFDRADIDTTSAIAAAAWCDAQVPIVDGEDTPTEVRSRCDYVLDTRAAFLVHAGEMLTPARVIPVIQGKTLRFVIDQAVTLSSVPTLVDSGSTSLVQEDGAGFSHVPVTSDATEVYLEFYDEANQHERTPIQVQPDLPASNRRIKRTEAKSIARRSEAERYARWLYETATHSPSIPDVPIQMAHGGLMWEAGDVFRFTSTRQAFDGYLRIMVGPEWSIGSASQVFQCKEYVPSVYSQTVSQARILTPSQRRLPLKSSPWSPSQPDAPADESQPRRVKRLRVARPVRGIRLRRVS